MNEIKDLLECIVKFDNTETLENKGRYFETIQKDAKRLVKLFAKSDISSSLFDLDGKTVPVTFHVSKYKPKIDIDFNNDH